MDQLGHRPRPALVVAEPDGHPRTLDGPILGSPIVGIGEQDPALAVALGVGVAHQARLAGALVQRAIPMDFGPRRPAVVAQGHGPAALAGVVPHVQHQPAVGQLQHLALVGGCGHRLPHAPTLAVVVAVDHTRHEPRFLPLFQAARVAGDYQPTAAGLDAHPGAGDERIVIRGDSLGQVRGFRPRFPVVAAGEQQVTVAALLDFVGVDAEQEDGAGRAVDHGAGVHDRLVPLALDQRLQGQPRFAAVQAAPQHHVGGAGVTNPLLSRLAKDENRSAGRDQHGRDAIGMYLVLATDEDVGLLHRPRRLRF